MCKMPIILLGCLLLAHCAQRADWQPRDDQRVPSPSEIAAWRRLHGFVEASAEDLAAAKNLERPFLKGRCVSPDGSLRLVWRGGALVGDACWGASTTSVYQLTDRAGRVLFSAPSRYVLREGGDASEMGAHGAWFSPDDKRILLVEDICWSCPPIAILFYQDPDRQGAWAVRFMDLGDTLNQPYRESNNPECRGMIGEDILIRNVHEGVSKIRIEKLEKAYPFPFQVG